MPSLISYFSAHPRRLFLADSLGALLSAALLGLLACFEGFFGLRAGLAGGACVLAAYSGSCFLRHPRNVRPWLALMIAANAAYAGVSAGVLLFFPPQRIWGQLYLAAELAVLALLLYAEVRVLLRLGPAR